MKCLIDADVLRYECGFAGQYKDEDTGEVRHRDIDWVCDFLDERIREIEEACEADEPSILFMTSDPYLNKLVNRRRKREGLSLQPHSPNFRFELAVSRPYKERKADKPFHYKNLTAHILDHYNCRVVEGIEADDAICIEQMKGSDTIICTRDKDLRMVPGMHYGWECGAQREFGPQYIDHIGSLSRSKSGKVEGVGLVFFYYQMLVGDRTDTIPGLDKYGPAKAYKLLSDCTTEQQMFSVVSQAYAEKLGEGWRDYFEEQAHLLWMIREIDDEGLPRHWQWPTDNLSIGDG